MQDLMIELERLSRELDQSVRLLRENGERAAQADREYHIAKSQTILRLKDEGVPATLISQMIKGEQAVVDKLFERDVARVLYDTNREHINVKKLLFRALEEQIGREWGRNG